MAPDVFAFGNLIGDTGDTAAPAVGAADVLRTRQHLSKTDAASRLVYDFNRDGVVNTLDLLVVRVAQRNPASLPTSPPLSAAAAASSLPAPPSPARTRAVARGILSDAGGDLLDRVG
jgi:hypothetical protein